MYYSQVARRGLKKYKKLKGLDDDRLGLFYMVLQLAAPPTDYEVGINFLLR